MSSPRFEPSSVTTRQRVRRPWVQLIKRRGIRRAPPDDDARSVFMRLAVAPPAESATRFVSLIGLVGMALAAATLIGIALARALLLLLLAHRLVAMLFLAAFQMARA